MPVVDTFGGSIRAGEEVTWGVPVAVTNSLEIVSCSLNRQLDRQPEGTLGRIGDRGRVPRRKYLASDNSSGDVVTEANYNDSTAMLLKHALGVVNSSAGPSPFTHTFTLGDLPPGLTIEKQWDSAQAEVFSGCKVASMVLSVDAGGLMQMTTSIMAQKSLGVVAATTPTYNAAPDPIKYSDAGTLSFNGNTYACIKSATLNLNNGIDVRPVLGTAFTKEPVPSSKREITLAVDVEWDTATPDLYADYQSGADSDVVITFTGAVSPDALTITLHNAHISEHSNHPLAGPEVVVDSVTFMAKSDGTDLGLQIDLVNANATSIIN